MPQYHLKKFSSDIILLFENSSVLGYLSSDFFMCDFRQLKHSVLQCTQLQNRNNSDSNGSLSLHGLVYLEPLE